MSAALQNAEAELMRLLTERDLAVAERDLAESVIASATEELRTLRRYVVQLHELFSAQVTSPRGWRP